MLVLIYIFIIDLSMFLRVQNCKFVLKQDGAGEARWAHNSEVGRSKLSPAQYFYVNL